MRTKEQYEHPSVFVDELLLEGYIMELSLVGEEHEGFTEEYGGEWK